MNIGAIESLQRHCTGGTSAYGSSTESSSESGTFKEALENSMQNSALARKINKAVTGEMSKVGEQEMDYFQLAGDDGTITYNGIVYNCDVEHNTITLGDMSNEEDVLTIRLAGGGLFKINRNNYDDLAKSIGMFSAEDQRRIMVAIAEDKKSRSIKSEIGRQENEVFSEIIDKLDENSEKAQDLSNDSHA